MVQGFRVSGDTRRRARGIWTLSLSLFPSPSLSPSLVLVRVRVILGVVPRRDDLAVVLEEQAVLLRRERARL